MGMGKDLYDAFPESKAVFDKADKVLGFSLSRFCFEGPLEELTRTENCQPAILVMSIAALEAFKSVTRYPLPVTRYVAGLSLGEYSALVAAGVLGFEDCLRLVSKRAQLMEAVSKRYPGKMSAILGLEKNVIKDICSITGAEIANLNCPGQIVISGGVESVEQTGKMALEKGAKRVIALEVSGAFHSSLMLEAALEFKAFLGGFDGSTSLTIKLERSRRIDFRAAEIPVVSNVTAKPEYRSLEIRENLIKQIHSPVLWEDSVRFMIEQGLKKFYEIGPGSVLKGLIRKIDINLEVRNIATAQDMYAS